MWMDLSPQSAIYLPWAVWVITWTVAALWADRTVKRPPFNREFYRILALLGFALLLVVAVHPHRGSFTIVPWPGFLGIIFWDAPLPVRWVMVGIAALGFVFAWWARLHLGRLWSGRITRKEGHHVVDTGPYAIVRHPIYTGILTAAIATTVEMGNLHAVLGTLFLIVGYWIKARQEERWLRDELGPENYDAYRRRVPMLVPFLA
jgi:protein-S-isoprenylcysteine O-methyltransferase Ste14